MTAALAACAQTNAVELRYKLRKGDRLVYRDVFERELKISNLTFRTRSAFLNHVVVVADANGTALTGVQRNRQSAELLEYRERGSDKLTEQKPKFAEQTAKRPAQFADANVYSSTGSLQTPIQVVREANSKRLYLVSEISPLPGIAVQQGSEWNDERSGQKVRLAHFETIAGENCAVVEDDGTRRESRVRYWFCPQSGLVRRLEFESEYSGFGDQRFHEKVSFELAEALHGETVESWLNNEQTQQAALRAYLISGQLVAADAVLNLLRSSRAEVQALALAVLANHGVSPPAELLSTLANSPDAEVRRIASRFAQTNNAPRNLPCAVPRRTLQPQKPGTTLQAAEVSALGSVPYLMRVPIDYRPDRTFPLIVYLSGGAGQALDSAFSGEDALRQTDYLALYPQTAGDRWWEQRSTDMVGALLSEVLRNYNVDTNRVYLAGFSNGGSGAVGYGALWPYRFAAISAMMGAGVYVPGNSGDKWPLANLLNVPMLLVHGDKDDIIPQRASLDTFDELKSLQPRVTPELRILKGREHDVTLSSDDGLTLPFLKRFTREPFPRNIKAKIPDVKYGRHYWLEVVEQNGQAELEGRILDNNTIDIKTKNVRKLRVLLRPELLSGTGPIRILVNGTERFNGAMQKDCGLFERSTQAWADPVLAYTQEITVESEK